MGRALGALHSLELDSSPMSALSEGLPRRLPHALFLHRPDHALYCNASYGNLQAVRVPCRSFPAFGALIDALTEEWRPSCLVHFDVKGDNIKISPKGASAQPFHRLGAGCAWRSSMGRRLHVRRLSRRVAVVDPDHWGTPAGPYFSLARFPLTRLQPALRAFWESYRLARGLTGRAETAFVLSATR